jgi:teichuronic acid biosynthesis glycosyltransferase TuaC
VLRVLSISTLYPNDSAPNFGVFVERQMQAVAQRGDTELLLVNPLGVPPWPLSRLARYRALTGLASSEMRGGVTVLRPRFRLLPGIGGRCNPGAIACSVLPLARRLHAEHCFDLVDAQFFYPDGPAAAHIAAALGLPLSIKARGSDIHFWGRQPSTAGQVRAAGMAASGMLAVASGLADDMAALGLPRERITIHRTGLDRTSFRPLDRTECRRKLGLPQDVALVACVGALIARKGQKHAIEALTHLPEAQLVLAGAGPDEAQLRAQANALGMADRVHFLGAVPHAALPEVLSAADVFVLPTASEGLANVWVEALACGTPVVTTPIPGAIELLSDPAFGRLAARDGAAIAEAVRGLLSDPPPRDAVAKGAAGFSWEENAAQLVAYWNSLIT